MRIKSVGECKFCQKEFSGSSMTKHLQSCSKRKMSIETEKGETEIFLIKAQSSPFWIFVEVDASSTLREVDSFLRGIWLECCGHLSAFEINGIRYTSYSEPDYNEMDMDVQLIDIIMPGLKMRHDYDFGSTTTLELKCISQREGKRKKQIELIARNNLPDYRCESGVCEKPAIKICCNCFEAFCDSCFKEHECDGECDEDMYLPVVNSPRMGVCGYGG